eukprot:Skav227353  [mRNA]  locus=scaffold1665:128519:129808:+ [translate_table: standard]
MVGQRVFGLVRKSLLGVAAVLSLGFVVFSTLSSVEIRTIVTSLIPAEQISKDVQLHQEPHVPRFAILIAGTLRRFHLNAGTHLVAPLTRANWTVDVFLSLFNGSFKGWSPESDGFRQDPQFDGLNRSGIQDLIERRFSMPGSRLMRNRIFDEHNLESQDVAFLDKNHFWKDDGGPYAGQGRIARSNFIMMWKELESMWYLALSQEHLYGSYSYVMILRDDAFWFRDFNLSWLLNVSGIEKAAGSGAGGHLYSMLCHRAKGGRTDGVIDYVFLLDRPAAETFCKCYSRIARPALFEKEWLAKYENDKAGGISEHFYLVLAKFADIQIIEVPTYLLPMQRVARLNGRMCLHKYCDSRLKSKNIPWLNPDMPLCTPKAESFFSSFWKKIGAAKQSKRSRWQLCKWSCRIIQGTLQTTFKSGNLSMYFRAVIF